MIFVEQGPIVTGVYIYSIIANICMLFMGLFLARFFAKLLKLDKRMLLPLILITCVVGSYASSNKTFFILVMVVFGVLGFLLESVGVSSSPLILGMVLGDLLETNLRQSLILSQGSYEIFFNRPICIFFWVLTVFMVAYPKVKRLIQKERAKAE